MGIGPTSPAWKAEVLPLNYTRTFIKRNYMIPKFFSCVNNYLLFFYVCCIFENGFIYYSMGKTINYIIDRSHLIHNIKCIKSLLNNNTKLCAIVKANAYGVGVKQVCECIIDYVDYLAVASVIEAREIRQFEALKPIVVLGEVDDSDISYCVSHNVDISISSVDRLRRIIKVLDNCTLNIHVKIDTGLNRYGIKEISQLKKIIAICKKSKCINLCGLMTHFATKSSDIDFVDTQYNKFITFAKLTPNAICHCANSYATIHDQKYHLDMCRVGFYMYGMTESECQDLLPVVSIKSKIMYIHNVKKSETIGYDRTFVADKDMTVAVVGMGYADGLNRRLSNNFCLLVKGEYVPIVGNICMDCCMVDCTGLKIHEGDLVTILGDDDNKKITLCDHAKSAGTSEYEILLKFNQHRMKIVCK